MDTNTIAAVAIFIATFALILSEKIDRMVVSLGGAVAMITAGTMLGFYSYKEALAMIELDTLTLLFGMMALVGMLERTGAFQYIAIKLAHMSKGKPITLLLMLGATTSVLSMFLDNVTTVVLIIPVTMSITSILRISPTPFLIGEATMSNIGGLATLVGDPPNLIIGSTVEGLSFMGFFMHLLPFAASAWLIAFGCILVVFRKEMSKTPKDTNELKYMRPADSLKDKRSAVRLFWVFAAVITLFFLSESMGIRPAVIAIGGACAGFVLTRAKVDDVLSKVEFNILIFFSGLFVTVGGLEHCGFLRTLSGFITGMAHENMPLCAMITIWSSGLASAIIDNIPFTIAMIPVIQSLGETLGNADLLTPLWWALAIGVGLGGNGTIIGATANVIAVRHSEKSETPITTKIWMKSGLSITLLSMLASSVLFMCMYEFMRTK